MSQHDFLAYQRGETNYQNHIEQPKRKQEFSYLLEHHDGSLIRQQISLQNSVEDILNNMSEALNRTGAVALPKPPKGTPPKAEQSNSSKENRWHYSPVSTPSERDVDHQYNRVSLRGRDLINFLKSLDHDEIQQRRMYRTDAQAAALAVRHLFQFQAVDAISLGWSSASVAVLLDRLYSFYDEYKSKFHVVSFYPMRLVFSADDFHDALDIYGGILRLNPASTPLQWLEKFQMITEEKLEEIHYRREKVVAMSKLVQGSLGVKPKKGHSCSNQEYYNFLHNISHRNFHQSADADSSLTLTLEPVVAIVEAAQACRRSVVTKEGTIRLGAGMSGNNVQDAISKLSKQAREQSEREKIEREYAGDVIRQVQYSYGLQKVYRAGVVDRSDFIASLLRILHVEESRAGRIKTGLTGNSLGIATSGQLCHLADDGSIVIPHDWR